MVELICLACGRTNPSDARFCSQCGAALLRRFCEQCRAINDADAHFCQACGAELAEQVLPVALPTGDDGPGVRHTRSSPRAIPTLREVMPAEDTPVAAAPPTLTPPDEMPAADLVAPFRAPRTPKPTHTRALLAVGGLIVLLVAFALWSRAPRTDVRPREADAPAARSASPTGTASAPPAASNQIAPAGAPPTTGSEAADAKAPDASGTSKAADGTATEAAPAPFDTPRPAATAPNVAPDRRRPAPTTQRPPRAPAAAAAAPSPAPVAECTPQLDALGLCASGTKPTGR